MLPGFSYDSAVAEDNPHVRTGLCEPSLRFRKIGFCGAETKAPKQRLELKAPLAEANRLRQSSPSADCVEGLRGLSTPCQARMSPSKDTKSVF